MARLHSDRAPALVPLFRERRFPASRGRRETAQTLRCSIVLEWSLMAQPSSAFVEPTPCTSFPSRPRLWSSAQSG